MNNDVIITCAVTGTGDTVGKHPNIPVTPEQVAESAIDDAKAGAAIVHCHVRDPVTCREAHNVEWTTRRKIAVISTVKPTTAYLLVRGTPR